MAEPGMKTVGLAALYDDPDALLRAARRVRDAGWTRWDCHTPYPVHGLDRAMGLRRSPIGYITIGAGFAGIGLALLLTGVLSAIHYPIRVGGKPLFSWQAFVPIIYETFTLCAAVATLIALIAFCRLGRWHSPLHDSRIMAEVTARRFVLVLYAQDERYGESEARRLLEASGCAETRPLVEQLEEDRSIL